MVKVDVKKGQISIEYLIIVGFVTFIVIGILGVALFYSGSISDKMIMTQVENFANKIISSSESVFYAGEPSKATITAFLPKGVDSIEIDESEDVLIITVQTNSGINKILFSSNVHIIENGDAPLSSSQGLKKIEIAANSTHAVIGLAT